MNANELRGVAGLREALPGTHVRRFAPALRRGLRVGAAFLRARFAGDRSSPSPTTSSVQPSPANCRRRVSKILLLILKDGCEELRDFDSDRGTSLIRNITSIFPQLPPRFTHKAGVPTFLLWSLITVTVARAFTPLI